MPRPKCVRRCSLGTTLELVKQEEVELVKSIDEPKMLVWQQLELYGDRHQSMFQVFQYHPEELRDWHPLAE